MICTLDILLQIPKSMIDYELNTKVSKLVDTLVKIVPTTSKAKKQYLRESFDREIREFITKIELNDKTK